MKYRGNTRNFELRVLEVGCWPVDEKKIGLFKQALARADPARYAIIVRSSIAGPLSSKLLGYFTGILVMTDSHTSRLPLKSEYKFGHESGLGDAIDSIKNMVIEWDRSYTSSLRRGYILELFERHGVFDDFKNQCWPNGNTRSGESMCRRFLQIKEDYEEFLSGAAPEEFELNEELADQAFAAEADLRDFLAANLHLIEDGLTLYQSDKRSGVEYPIDGGRIDILGVDASGRYVVIELKLSKGRQKTVGQLLYYMSWVDENKGNGPCRGVIIAREIPPDVILTMRRTPGVQLYEYNLQVSLNRVGSHGESA